jgi:uncharacterized protein (DUF305 family)
VRGCDGWLAEGVQDTPTATADTGPADTDPGDTGPDETDDDFIVLPWWQNPLNIIAMIVAVLVLAGGAGFVLGERSAIDDPTDVDVGFLQDMRDHHEQAVEMALLYVGKGGGTDSTEQTSLLRTIAKEIAFDQGVEIGRMVQLLRTFGEPEANPTETAMGWMNQPVPYQQMPGLASDADMNRLAQASGPAADMLFATLMIAHHEGGITMAAYAQDHAETDEVKAFAKGIIAAQKSDLVELRRIVAQLEVA